MKSNLKIVFGETLKELRIQKSLTQQQLADYTSMDRAFISELERGLLLPSQETFFKLAYQLKIKSRDLADKIDQRLKP